MSLNTILLCLGIGGVANALTIVGLMKKLDKIETCLKDIMRRDDE